MHNDIKLSVMVTFCNQKEFIKDALDNCINQKVNFKYELLVGLDNGDNESREIINNYIKKYSNIKLFEIDNSKLDITNIEKASNNRLNLLKHAKGEYICFLDGDDFYIDNNRHQIMVDFLDNNPNYIAVFHELSHYNNKTKEYTLKASNKSKKEYHPKDYLKTHRQFSCFVYRNIFLGKLPRDFNSNFLNDSTFTLYFLRYGIFYNLPYSMVGYRTEINSIYNSKNELLRNIYALLSAEINHKILLCHEKELCSKYKKILNICFKNKYKISNLNQSEIEKIKKCAIKENCFFTNNLLNYKNLSLIEKIKLLYFKFLYSKFKINILINKNNKRKLTYFNFRPNFGDELNLYILQRVLNLDIKNTGFKKCHLLGIGSVLGLNLNDAKKKKQRKNILKIWGTGFIKEKEEDREYFKRKSKILALRGKYTKQRVENILNKKLECPLGDPGLLASILIKNKPNKEYKVGIIPHYVDKNSDLFKNIKLKNYNVIDITKNPIYILNEIAKCEVILSSAMHGLIASDSLNIPNQWIKFGDLLCGGDYKFKDYYSVFNYNPKAIDLREEIIDEKSIDEIKKLYKKLDFKKHIEEINANLINAGKKI